MYFLGIDSGTQSTKAIVVDLESGQIVAQASEKYELIEGLPTGHLEQHPQDWTRAVDTIISACVAQLGDRRKLIRGIGVSGQQHGLVALDHAGEVVRPAKLWCDTSTMLECEELAASFAGSAGLIELAGNAIPPGFTAPKILWLKKNEPENFARTATVLLPHDYLNYYLTGVKRMEFGDASGTGLLNIRTREWCAPLVDAIDPRVREMLPPLGSSLERHGELRPELRERWGLEKGIVVSAGGGDNMMGAIGTGNVNSGVVTASLGTSGTLFACSSQPIIDPKGEVAAFCDSADQWMPLVCTMNVTVLTEQLRELFAWDHATLEKHVSASEPGANGLTFLPYLNGERTPNLPRGTGVLHGLRTDNMTASHLARAAVEGVTIGLAYGLKRFKELGLNPSEIRITGGGSKSSAWRQIVADSFGVPVVGLATSEGAGLGAAIQAAYVALHESGQRTSIAELAARLVTLDPASKAEPNAANVSFYQAQLERQMALTHALAGSGYL
jgi:xylulokinase